MDDSYRAERAVAGAMPLVSVVVPTKDRAHLLPATLRSALAQTVGSIEVIVVDNGSTDETGEVTAAFRALDPRVVAAKETTPGPAAARNTGLGLARGTWVSFLDDDDLWVPEALERLLAGVASAGEAVAGRALCFCSGSGELTPQQVLAAPPELAVVPWPAERRESWITAAELLWRPQIPTDAALFRTAALRALGGFDLAYPTAEDYDLWLRVAWRQPVPRVDGVVVLCRRHGAQLSTDQTSLSRQTRRVVEAFLTAHPEARRQLGRCRSRRRLAGLHREEAYEALLADDRPTASKAALRSLLLWPGEMKSGIYLVSSLWPGLFVRVRTAFRGAEK